MKFYLHLYVSLHCICIGALKSLCLPSAIPERFAGGLLKSLPKGCPVMGSAMIGTQPLDLDYRCTVRFSFHFSVLGVRGILGSLAEVLFDHSA